MRVGYIGIGTMGSAIAMNLRKAGVPVAFVVFDDQDRQNAVGLSRAGAREAPDYATLAAESEAIMVSVPDSSVVEMLMLGEGGIGPFLRQGQIVVDMGTSYPISTRAIAKALEAKGIAFLDAGLSGSRPQAESRTLTVMCGGSKDAYEKVKPLLEATASHVFHVGPAGSGHAMKLINNFLALLNLAAICEMLPFAQKFGVDLQALYEVISVSGGGSTMFQRLVPKLLKRDFSVTFMQRLAWKDIRYFNDLMREESVPSPLAAALLTVYDMASAKGYAKEDMSALLHFWEEMCGVTVGSAVAERAGKRKKAGIQ